MKKVIIWVSFCLCLAIAAACTSNNMSGSQDSIATQSDTTMMGFDGMAHADISATKADTSGSGPAEFSRKDDGTIELTLNLNFPAMANKTVAVHLHEHGDCGDEGKGAHGHWNPTNEDHGQWGSSAFHSGDIGNVELDANGSGSYTLATDRWTIGGDENTNILGRAVIVHSGVDDYTSQPAGNAGSRIACGVISGM
jgi:Cu-Zn family superoxide dismutase